MIFIGFVFLSSQKGGSTKFRVKKLVVVLGTESFVALIYVSIELHIKAIYLIVLKKCFFQSAIL